MDTVITERLVKETGNNKIEPAVQALSNQIIPAVRGEYYSYSSEFSGQKPVYVLMKCKANKNRSKDDLLNLGDEANLIFLFNHNENIQVCSVKDASDLSIIDESIKSAIIHDTKITQTNLLSDEFYKICSTRDGSILKDICTTNPIKHRVLISLKFGMVISMMTTSGKYGLFLVKDLGNKFLRIDACHILL